MVVLEGLDEQEVLARRARGQGNNVQISTGRTYREILQQNVFNFINILLFTIGAVLVTLGRISDAVLSVGLIFMNIGVGVYQEVRAKRTLDKIALLTRPRVTVLRSREEKNIDPGELVLGDLIVARPGDQIVVDGVVVGNGTMDVDESLLTGESDLVTKHAGDQVFSGSFCVTGSAIYEAQKVGADSFANKLTASARQFRVVKTPLQRDIDLVLRILILIAGFIGLLLLVSAILYAIPLTRSVQMAAVVAGLIPNGLFFMVIIAYAMGALRIAGRGALIQQTNSVESLSNVTVLCTDKTGTLTANQIKYSDVFPADIDKAQFQRLLGDFAASVTIGNRTSDAIVEALPGQPRRVIDEVQFSSARKWSALTFDDEALCGVYVLGAMEMLEPYLDRSSEAVRDFAAQLTMWSDSGLRVILFAHLPEVLPLHDDQGQPRLPDKLVPLGLVSFTDQLREGVQQTINEFVQARVRLKVISGDNPLTVAALARQAGMPGNLKVISGPEIDQMDDAQLSEVADTTTIFGRITPQQKERIVDALRRRGDYVAMIGDGVNDVLSLKKANIGIAMQSGSAATRGVADIVLLNDSFAALPPAFMEGQRIINGMQDILRLFLTRAFIVALLILSIAVVDAGFPYIPTHVSLLTMLTVAGPTLGLAVWARPGTPKPGLLRSVINFVFPAATTVFIFGLTIYLVFYTLVLTAGMQLGLTPEDVAGFEMYRDVLIYNVNSPDTFVIEIAGLAAQSALTVFTVLTGLLLVIFVEPPTEFFVGGDEYSGDIRPTILSGLLLLVFIAIMVIEPIRNFFQILPLPFEGYLLIVLMVVLWFFVMRFVWRKQLFQRFMGMET